MKSRIVSLFAGLSLLLVGFVSIAVSQDCVSQGGIVVAPGQGVTFAQVSYSFADAREANSSTGQVDINVPQLTTTMTSGYVNVLTNAGWVAQNVPIVPGFASNYGYSNVSTTFNLNIQPGTPVPSLNAEVCYTPQPLVQISDNNFSTFTMVYSNYNAEGLGDMNLTQAPDPPQIAGMQFDPQGQNEFAMQPNHQNVQTAFMQCGPAAFANNFTWLNSFWGVPIPDANVKGLRNFVPGSLVGKMDMSMQSYRTLYGRCFGDMIGRWALNRGVGTGVPVISQVFGSMQYLSRNGINLTLKHQGSSPFQCDGFTGARNYTVAGLTSTGQGATVDPNFIINEIAADSAVEYNGVWYNRLGQPLGGHVMDVIGAGTTGGRPWIMYVSDHLQTNQDPTDRLGTDKIDFSYLQPTSGQPKIIQGQMNGAYAVAVITQHP